MWFTKGQRKKKDSMEVSKKTSLRGNNPKRVKRILEEKYNYMHPKGYKESNHEKEMQDL